MPQTEDDTVESFHFEDPEVMEALIGTSYLKENVRRHIGAMTSGQKWSLYRAIVKLADQQRGKNK